MTIEILLIVLVALQVKHFLCDYPLQNQYMLRKANEKDWAIPLFAHSLVHSIGTFIIFLYFGIGIALLFSVIDLVLHFIVDRIKASPNIGNRWTIDKPQFWWALGLDQMAHHIINILFVYYVFKNFTI